MPVRRPLALALAGSVSALVGACSGNHHGLGPDEGSSASSTGATGSGGAGTSTGASGNSTVGAGGHGGEPFDAGPRGPTKLTILNGVADADAVRLCFLPYPDGDPSAEPWPADAAGLGFARRIVVDPIDATIPTGADVRTTVFAGDLGAIAGKSCDEAIALAADPLSGVVAAALPVLPALVWDSDKSLLFVPTGCLGGEGHTSASQTLACGMTYTPETPTGSLVVLGISRATDPDAMALQIVHADVAMPAVDFKLTPIADGVEQAVAPSLAYGGAAPNPPFTKFDETDIPLPSQALLKTYFPGQMYPTSAVFLSDAFSHGDLSASDLHDGAGYALVAVGGYPGVAAEPWWHAMTYAAIETDP